MKNVMRFLVSSNQKQFVIDSVYKCRILDITRREGVGEDSVWLWLFSVDNTWKDTSGTVTGNYCFHRLVALTSFLSIQSFTVLGYFFINRVIFRSQGLVE